ncbi:MAG: helix-turn-helix domain-containing protein [Novosphingobium sp.]
MSRHCQVKVNFHLPPPELQSYFTTFYLVDIDLPDGTEVVDRLHPEWGNLRFYSGKTLIVDRHDGSRLTGSSFAATGPSSKAVRFEVGRSRVWGIGLLPLGWAKFLCVPAATLADAVLDGHSHPDFACFAPLAATLFAGQPDERAELARITEYFLGRLGEPVPDEQRINAIHAALLDPEVASVAQIVAQAGIGQRTVERICDRAFGFPPKLLLRRQRFMRSLAQYMLDPSLKWIGAIDGHYHDQAQFVRDFRRFMGMTPREYGALDKPILSAVMHERARIAGQAVQALHCPNGRT